MRKTYLLLFLACFFTSVSSFAQAPEQEEGSLNSGTISSQFDYLHSVSNNFQEYKVVKKTNLDKIQKNITDSLNVYKNQIGEIQQELAAQKSQIDQFENRIAAAESEREAALAEKDNFAVFGMPIHKNSYSNIMWGIVIFLGLALLFFLYQFKKSHKVTSETLRTLEETREEFDQHRKNTLERERKLNRQLVDEMNKRQVRVK
jgi:Skp family chaperone for outer membrane proteins